MSTRFSSLLLAALVLASPVSEAASKPNVLFIVCDDLNTHVSPAGYSPIVTPNLAKLARQAMTFNRAFCQYPVCGPSRASFLSGLYPESTGVLDNKLDIRETRPGTTPMPEYFKKNGYWTASVGKVFHSPRHEQGQSAWNECLRFENDELPVLTAARRKFEAEHGSIEDPQNRKAWKRLKTSVLDPLNAQTPPGHGRSGLTDAQHKDGKNARQVIQWLEEQSYGEKPFFIACGIQKPHVPFLAPDNYFDLYPLGELRYHLDAPDLWEHLPKSAIANRYVSFGFELAKENEALRREYMQAYHACVSFIDAQIGGVLEAVKAQGLWENTVILLTSDHGYHLGDHFLWGKVTLFDIGTRVPFIVYAPGVSTPGTAAETMVELVDIYPTLTELAGLETPVDLQGASLVPVIRNPSISGTKTHAYTVVSRGANLGRAIRDQQWRYAKWTDGEELYDLVQDPHERENLAAVPEFAAKLREMREVLDRKQAEAVLQRRPL